MNASGLGSKAAASLGSILDYLGARFQLFALEAKEARNGLILKLILFVIGGFFLLLAWLGVSIGIAGVLILKLGWLWPWAAFAVAGGHLFVGVIILLCAKRKFANQPFEDSVRELARDREWLNSHRNSNDNDQES